MSTQFAGAALVRFLGTSASGTEAPALQPAPLRVVPFGAPQGAVVALDHNLRYTSVTADAAAMLGTTRDTLLGQHVWTVFPECEATPLGLMMRDVLRSRRSADLRTPVHDRPDTDLVAQCFPTPDGGLRLLFRFATRVPVSLPERMTGTH